MTNIRKAQKNKPKRR